MQSLKLVIYSDYVCPWCYVGQAAVERLKSERPVEVDWRPFFLHPDTPPEGLRLSGEARERWRPTHDRLREMAADANMPMVFPELISNTRRALEATEYARERGRLEEFHRLGMPTAREPGVALFATAGRSHAQPSLARPLLAG